MIDFGGGTLDVTILEFGKGVFVVKATSGNTQLGGADMGRVIQQQLAARFREQTGIDVTTDRAASAHVKEASEVVKIELSTSTTTHYLPTRRARRVRCTSWGWI